MASIISAGTTSGTAIAVSGDTTGDLAFTTQAGANTITVPNVTGTILTTGTAGTVLQVVSTTTSTPVSSSTTALADTGLTATITPKFATSKILVLVNQSGLYKSNGNSVSGVAVRLLRGASIIANLADPVGYTGTASTLYCGTVSISYYDNPATTSAITYKTQFANNGAASSVSVQVSSEVSTITLMEIAA